MNRKILIINAAFCIGLASTSHLIAQTISQERFQYCYVDGIERNSKAFLGYCVAYKPDCLDFYQGVMKTNLSRIKQDSLRKNLEKIRKEEGLYWVNPKAIVGFQMPSVETTHYDDEGNVIGKTTTAGSQTTDKRVRHCSNSLFSLK